MRGSCLCGAVAWRVEGPAELMAHCHCGRCRKVHGTGFGTYLGVPEGAFAWLRGEEQVQRWPSSPGVERPFCGRCGTVLPSDPADGRVLLPAGPLDDDPGLRPMAHIFVASRAPWDEIADGLPRFEAFPPGFEGPLVETPVREAPRPGVLRGGCLCGTVRYELHGPATLIRHCHCGRCRKARAAAHATNLFAPASRLHFTQGSEALRSWKVPEARSFTQVFCGVCGACQPRLDPARGLAAVPLGSLEDDPGLRPVCHIFVGSKAPWFELADDLRQHEGAAPA